jgi:hypothetical protein
VPPPQASPSHVPASEWLLVPHIPIHHPPTISILRVPLSSPRARCGTAALRGWLLRLRDARLAAGDHGPSGKACRIRALKKH